MPFFKSKSFKNWSHTIFQHKPTVCNNFQFFFKQFCILSIPVKNYLTLLTVDSKYQCEKPLMRLTFCRSNFHAARHSATCHSMQKLCRSHTKLTSTLFLAFCCILPCDRVWTHLKITYMRLLHDGTELTWSR